MSQTAHAYTFTRLDCGHCGQKIANNQLLLLRESSALPEEATIHTHGFCADPFIKEHPGRWNKIAANSMEAGWLLPLFG